MTPNNIFEFWQNVITEVQELQHKEEFLQPFFYDYVLQHNHFSESIANILSKKLCNCHLDDNKLKVLFNQVFQNNIDIQASIIYDIKAFIDRDPAVNYFSTPLLYFKGFHALSAYRISHYLWHHAQQSTALFMQSRISEAFSVDIHPAARIGHGILIDHATSLVIGETAVVNNNVSMLHEVTLGGNGKERGDRHPKIGEGVLIGSGAKILGNVRVGHDAKIGAGSVVLTDVKPHSTVAGVPAKYVGHSINNHPSLEMKHDFS